VALIDALLVVVMTGRRIVAWYDRPGPAPTWVTVIVAGFAALSLAAVIVGQVP